MKTQSTSFNGKKSDFLFIFLTSLGLGYTLTNHFILSKPNESAVLTMICLFFVSIASWQRKKEGK
ncbi:hypothetical protein ACFSJW_23870 [Flavobacterium artemisiae]|uniref:PEP-CTERM protein-sorting domain-containing protein n=1 Tax=Flavobacterium artemisiae TaxID=2126556 RepID=A0ABW4H8D2_9FLAO